MTPSPTNGYTDNLWLFQERQREYGKRLAKAAHAIYLKHKDPSPEPVMSDSQKTDMEKALYGQVIHSVVKVLPPFGKDNTNASLMSKWRPIKKLILPI